MESTDILIIGASAAGIAAASTLKKLDPTRSIIIATAESHKPYNKCQLVDVATETRSYNTIFLPTYENLVQQGVQFKSNCVVEHIDRKTQIAQTSQDAIKYTKLIVACGTQARKHPAIKAADNVCYFHTLADLDKLLALIQHQQPKTALVIGAGLSGLEVTDALVYHGIQTTLIDASEHILPRHTNLTVANWMQQKLASQNVCVLTSRHIAAAHHEGPRLQSITLDDGTTLTADLVIVTIGAESSLKYITGLDGITDTYGFLPVNEYLQTADSNVYAAGDIIVTRTAVNSSSVRSTLWPDAVQQGMHAAQAICGTPKPYTGIVPLMSSSFMGMKFVSCGTIEGAECRRFEVTEDTLHAEFTSAGKLCGFVLINNAAALPQLRKELLSK